MPTASAVATADSAMALPPEAEEGRFAGANPSFAHPSPKARAGAAAGPGAGTGGGVGGGIGGSGAVEMPSVLDISPDALWDELTPDAQRGIVRAQALARGYLVRRYFRRVAAATQRMPLEAFAALVGFFVLAKVGILVVLVLAWADAFTDFGQAPPVTGLAQWASPMQDHPHDWGAWYQHLLESHLVSGLVLFATVLVPVVVRKGGDVHVWVGRIFLGAWCWHMFDGLVNASTVLLNRGYHEELYPTDGFTMWLYVQFAFIANMVCDYIVHALAAVRYKAAAPRGLRRLLCAVSIHSVLYTLAMVVIGLYVLAQPEGGASEDAEEYAIIFLVDFPVWGYLCLRNLAYWAGYDPVPHMYTWLVEHQRNILFVAHMTVITGVANATYKYSRTTGRAPWLTTALFASQEVAVLFWVLYKEKRVNDVLRAAVTTSAAQRRRMQARYNLNSMLMESVRAAVASGRVKRGAGVGAGGDPALRAVPSFLTVGTDHSYAATDPDADVFHV